MNKRLFGALGTVILGAGVIAGIGTYVASAKNDSRILAATRAGTYETPDGKTVNHYTLDLSAYPDSMFGGHGKNGGAHPDWVSYGPGATNFSVPAHSAVTITIKNFDSGEKITNDFFSSVRGTIGGTAILNGVEVTNIPADKVGHTFTLHGLSDGQDQLFVNVPLQLAPDAEEIKEGYSKQPSVTTFTFITGGEGEYIWNCEFPCGDGTVARFGNAMSSMSYMSGHFNVVNCVGGCG